MVPAAGPEDERLTSSARPYGRTDRKRLSKTGTSPKFSLRSNFGSSALKNEFLINFLIFQGRGQTIGLASRQSV